MKPFLITVVALLFAVAGVALGQTQQGAPPAPKLVIAQAEHNFGEVKAGEVVTHTFVVKNEGKADLLIKNVVPG